MEISFVGPNHLANCRRFILP